VSCLKRWLWILLVASFFVARVAAQHAGELNASQIDELLRVVRSGRLAEGQSALSNLFDRLHEHWYVQTTEKKRFS